MQKSVSESVTSLVFCDVHTRGFKRAALIVRRKAKRQTQNEQARKVSSDDVCQSVDDAARCAHFE